MASSPPLVWPTRDTRCSPKTDCIPKQAFAVESDFSVSLAEAQEVQVVGIPMSTSQ